MSNPLQPIDSNSVSRGKPAPSILKRLTKQKRFDQLCLLLLDGSGSMTHKLESGVSKAVAAAKAASGLLASLQASSNAPSFSLGIICFAEKTEVRLFTQNVVSLEGKQIDFTPFPKGATCRYTLVADALNEAEKMAEAFLNSVDSSQQLKRTVRIMLITDGFATDEEKAITAANRIKEKWQDIVRINTALFGRKEEDEFERAESTLKQLASTTPEGKLCYTKTPSEAELRAFFERSSTAD